MLVENVGVRKLSLRGPPQTHIKLCIPQQNPATIIALTISNARVYKLADTPLYGFSDNSFKAAGGIEGIRQLVDDFYREMDSLPEAAIIRKMHKTDLTESRDKLALFLCGWMGGPRLYQEKYGSINIPRSHMHLPIGEAERDAWLLCMERAVLKQGYSLEFSGYLLNQLAIPAERIFATSKKPIA